MAQTVKARSFLDRPWTFEDVITIPSDSESCTGSDDEEIGYDVPRLHVVHDQHPDSSLPSISAIAASMVNVRRVSMGEIETSTTERCVGDIRENSDLLVSSSPSEVLLASSILESPLITADSDLLVSPPIQQHDHAVNPVLCTPTRGSCVVSAASQCASAQPALILPLNDKVLQEQDADSSCQACLSSVTNLIQPLQPRDRSAVLSKRCVQVHSTNNDHNHLNGVVPQGDDELHVAAQPALANTPPSECSGPVSPRGSSTEGDQQHQAGDDLLPLLSCLGPSPTCQRRQEKRQASINANQTVNELDEPSGEMEEQSCSHRGFEKAYNLRPFPIKRQLTAEQNDGGFNKKLMSQRKRRKLVFPQPKKRSSQQGSELMRNRKAHFLRRNATNNNDNASIANTENAARFSVARDWVWPLGHPVLRCTKENGTAMFQLQFTSDTLWNTLVAQNDPAPRDHQPPNKVEGQKVRTRKKRSNQRTENIAEQSIQTSYPNVCSDIHQMDSLLARWRKHIFLVKWSDATTTWEPRKHLIDMGMLDSFETSWQGFDAGVDVLGARLRAGKHQHLLHWHGRPSREDTWVHDEFLSPQLMGRIQANEMDGAHV